MMMMNVVSFYLTIYLRIFLCVPLRCTYNLLCYDVRGSSTMNAFIKDSALFVS